MSNKQGGSRNSARHIALGGVSSALALVILLAGGYISIGTYVAPILAGLVLMPIAMDISRRVAVLAWVAVSALGALLVPDMELVLFFILLFGYYPILYPSLGKIKSKVLRYVVKFLLFNAVVAAVYCLLFFVFSSPALLEEIATNATWFWVSLVVVGNVIFGLYDILIDKVRIIYVHRIRRYFFR